MLCLGSYENFNHINLSADGAGEFFLRYWFSIYLEFVAIDKQENVFLINGPDMNNSIIMKFLD